MTDPAQNYGREPLTIVELEQPRCALRFGTAPCAAVGTPKCYQTFETCRDRANYAGTGKIVWRFCKPEAGVLPLYEEADAGNTIKTNPLPMLVSVNLASSKLNIGAARNAESPLGVRAAASVTLRDMSFDDHIGDFYLGDRAGVRGTFWAKWQARNPFYAGMYLRVYQGYRGQALADMQVRLYILESMDGPDASGRVVLRGLDPLRLADKRRASFPREMDVRLKADINAGTTTIHVYADEADLADTFGTAGLPKYLRVNDEILSYTGHTVINAGTKEMRLDGVARAALNTEADDHEEDDACNRVGRYEGETFWDVAYDLLTNHTDLPAAFIDYAQWDTEGTTYLNIFEATGTVAEPVSVEELLGELCQQGLFSIWWDERAQTIPMLAVRPPIGTVQRIDDNAHILEGASLRVDPDARITRLILYYSQRVPTEDEDKVSNYARARIRIETEYEQPERGGEVRTKKIFARWIREDALAITMVTRLLSRYKEIPRYIRFGLDAKDRAIKIGDILEIDSRLLTDAEGNRVGQRWQVISAEESKGGDTIVYEAQTYAFTGLFAHYMPDGSDTYDDATDEERDSGVVGWYAADTGYMPNGDNPYQYQ
jgi:hypothetical protein